jgi:hypothetical protein
VRWVCNEARWMVTLRAARSTLLQHFRPNPLSTITI